MTNHFCALVNDNPVVVMIKCFAPPHGHVQIALLCGSPFFVFLCLWLRLHGPLVCNKLILSL